MRTGGNERQEETATTEQAKNAIELDDLSAEVLTELTNRVMDIDNRYRGVAEKMGQLYMYADENKISGPTAKLDKPMRNASENEQMFASILEELKLQANRRT